MTFLEFKQLLLDHADHGITLTLPDGSTAPAHFHITEVATISKAFVDCGGKRHSEEACVLQVWVADDYDHRIQAGKLARILDIASDLFDSLEVPVEFEHEAPVLTRMPIETAEVIDGNLAFQLSLKKADCLAKELCLPKRDFSLPEIPTQGLTSSLQLFKLKDSLNP